MAAAVMAVQGWTIFCVGARAWADQEKECSNKEIYKRLKASSR